VEKLTFCRMLGLCLFGQFIGIPVFRKYIA
jgi:hypothetical protein